MIKNSRKQLRKPSNRARLGDLAIAGILDTARLSRIETAGTYPRTTEVAKKKATASGEIELAGSANIRIGDRLLLFLGHRIWEDYIAERRRLRAKRDEI